MSEQTIVGHAEPHGIRATSKIWNARRLPTVDYASHPAYGGLSKSPTLTARLTALNRFSRAFTYAAVRRLIDYETLPILSKDAAKPQSRSLFAARYMVNIAKVHTARSVAKLTGQRVVSKSDPAMLEAFRTDGFLRAKFSQDDMKEIARLCAPAFAELRARRSAIALDKRKFDDNMFWMSKDTTPEAYAHVTNVLEKSGILACASEYLRRPVAVKHINPQLNDAQDTFWKRQFPDTTLDDPVTTFMHVDTTYSILKFMFYLTPITKDEDGPFSYVQGSNNAVVSNFEGLVRRATEYAGLSSKKPEQRALFMALPSALRKKCDFGNDMVSGSPEAQEIVRDEVKFYSTEADGILFAPNGIHRGGMVKNGERLVVTVLITET